MSSSKSSISNSKLLHLTDLPNNKKYVAHQMGHLLPFHHSSLKQNILTMIYYQSSNFQRNIIYDCNLTMYSSNYSKIRGGWCEDIDNDDNHLKKSMQVGIIIINYLHSLCSSKIKHNHSENSILSSGQSFYISSKYQHYKNNKKEIIQIQRDPQPFTNSQSCISYNIYKHNKKYIFITGVNQCNSQGFFQTMSIFRKWNFKRLKCPWLQLFNIKKISLSLQHLIAISRGFIINFQESSVFNRCDHDLNQNKKYLKTIINSINLNKDDIQLQIQELMEKEKLIFDQLEQSFIFYKFNFTYKSTIQQAKFVSQMQNKMAKVLCHVLSQIPNNISVSYCGRFLHQQSSQKIVLLFVFNYKSGNTTHKLISNLDVNRSLSKVCQLIQRQCYLQLKNSNKTIADQVFRNSYVIFNKFNKEINPKDFSQLKKRQGKNQQFFNSQMKQSHSVQSIFINSGKNSELNNQHDNSAQINQSKIVALSKSVAFDQMEKQYGKLITHIEQHKSIFTDKQLINFLKKYLFQINKKINQKQTLEWKQISALKFIGATCIKLNPQQIHMLIKNNLPESEAILQFFIQQVNIDKMIQVINLEQQTINSLFKQYLNEGFGNIRYHYLLSFLKKLMNQYLSIDNFSSTSNDFLNLQFTLDNNQFANLISLISEKEGNQRKYINFIGQYLPVIFQQNYCLRFIASILYNFYISLVGSDHHEQLVNSFIAQICYEVLYYSNQFNEMTLNNTIYLRNNTDLKYKKIKQLVRRYGFMGLGFQIKNILLPFIIQNGFVKHKKCLLANKIKIVNPLYFKRVLDLLVRSHHTDNIIEVINYVKFNQDNLKSVNKPIQFYFFKKDFIQFQFSTNSDYFNLNLNLSQSGIFNQISKINPNFKIAGKNITNQIDKKIYQYQKHYNQFTLKYIDQNNILGFNAEQSHQLINLAKSLKIKYQKLNSMKFQQKAYMKEAFQQIYNKKSQIFRYLQCCEQAKLLQQNFVKVDSK